MLYYNIALISSGPFMTYHHHAGEPHPAPAISLSLLRLSAPQRLAIAAVLIALMWTAFFWAVR